MWETLLEMDRCSNHAGERNQRAVAMGLGLAKVFEWVSLLAVWLGRRISKDGKTQCGDGEEKEQRWKAVGCVDITHFTRHFSHAVCT